MDLRNKRWQVVLENFKTELANLSEPVRVEGIDFVCPIDLEVGMMVEDATHSIADAFLPRAITRKRGITALICRHCNDSGF